MKTFKFSLVLRTRENTDVFITLDDNIYGIHSQRVNILYLSYDVAAIQWITSCHKNRMTLHNTLAGTSNVMTTSMSTMHFLLNNCQL